MYTKILGGGESVFQTINVNSVVLRRKRWHQIYTMNSYYLGHSTLLEYGDYKAFEERIYASSKLKNDPSPNTKKPVRSKH